MQIWLDKIRRNLHTLSTMSYFVASTSTTSQDIPDTSHELIDNINKEFDIISRQVKEIILI